MRSTSRIPTFQLWADYLTAWLDRRREAMRTGIAGLGLKIQDDPEAIFQEGWLLCDVGEHDAGFREIQRAVENGYFVAPTLARSRQFDALRSDSAFQSLLARAEAGREHALAAFLAAGGERLLGA
jgi:hypothetical protein